MIKSYRNKRNHHKYIDVKVTNDHHYLWRQLMKFDNGIVNNVGTKKGGFRRQRKTTIIDVLKDYEVIDND